MSTSYSLKEIKMASTQEYERSVVCMRAMLQGRGGKEERPFALLWFQITLNLEQFICQVSGDLGRAGARHTKLQPQEHNTEDQDVSLGRGAGWVPPSFTCRVTSERTLLVCPAHHWEWGRPGSGLQLRIWDNLCPVQSAAFTNQSLYVGEARCTGSSCLCPFSCQPPSCWSWSNSSCNRVSRQRLDLW